MRAIHFLLVLWGLAFTSGCQFGPSAKQLAALNQLRPGSTTREEARSLLGKPWLVESGDQGHLDIYQLGRRQLDREGFNPGHLIKHGDVIDVTMVHLLFDPRDILQRTNHYRWQGRAKVQAFLVNRIGPKFTELDPERIQPGSTTMVQLEEWYGPPVLFGPNANGKSRAVWFSTEHAYGGYVDGFQHRNLTVELDAGGTVTAFAFRGKLKPAKR